MINHLNTKGLIRNRFIKAYLIVALGPCLMLFGGAGRLSAQIGEESYGSGLEVHLLVDVSRSIWPSTDGRDLKNILITCIQEVPDNLRPLENEGDKIAVYLFADRLEMLSPVRPVEDQKVVRESISSAMLRVNGTVNQKLDVNKTDFATALGSVYESIASEHETYSHRTRIVLMVSDGINDPYGSLGSKGNIVDYENIPLIERNRISNKISDLRNLLNTNVCLLHLPYERVGPNQLKYAYEGSWDSLLNTCRFASKTLEGLQYAIKNAFLSMRSIVLKRIRIIDNLLKCDRWMTIRGRLRLRVPPIQLRLINIEFKVMEIQYEGMSVPIDETSFESEERKGLLAFGKIYPSRTDTTTQDVEVLFRIPRSIREKERITGLTVDMLPHYINAGGSKEFLLIAP